MTEDHLDGSLIRLIPVRVIFRLLLMIGLTMLVGDCVSILTVGDCVVAVSEGDADVAVGAFVAGVSDGDAVGATVVAFNDGAAVGEFVVAAIDGAVVAKVGDFVGVVEFDISLTVGAAVAAFGANVTGFGAVGASVIIVFTVGDEVVAYNIHIVMKREIDCN